MTVLQFPDRLLVRRLAALGLTLVLAVPAACAKGDGERTAGEPPGPPARHADLPGSSPYGSYLAGRHAERSRDTGAAARFLSETLAADPENVALLRRTFILMISDGRVEESLDLARRLIQWQEKEPVSNLLLAVEAARNKDFLVAGERLSGLPRRGGNEILVPLLLGWMWFGENKPDEAMKALAPLGKVQGFESFYDLHSAALLDLAGRTDEAGELYERALGASKRPSLRLIVALASFYQRTGRTDDARRLLTDFLKDSGNSVIASAAIVDLDAGKDLPPLVASATDGMAEALFNVASALYQENVTQTALVYGRMALYLKPDFPPDQLLVANILEVNGRREEAIAEYSRIGKGSPLSWNARLAVARNLDDLDRADQAVELLEAMADERPKRTEALIALGDLHRAGENYQQAVEAYDRAFERIENEAERNWGLFYARGIALERSKQWGRAEADFLHALELQPNQPYVLNYLGYSWVEQGINLDRAKKMLEMATNLRRDDGYIIDSLGWAMYRTGEYSAAVRHLERAVELRPHDPTINDHLGDAYWRVGRTHEARFQWRRALSLDPTPEDAPEIEGKIERGLGAAEAVGQAQ